MFMIYERIKMGTVLTYMILSKPKYKAESPNYSALRALIAQSVHS